MSGRGSRASLVAEERPELLIFCGIAGLTGNVAPVLAMAIAALVAEHQFVADTVSDLARGPHKWIMDLGFYLNAGGLLGLSIAAAHVHLGRAGWSFGLLCLAFTALVITLLGLWDEFHTAADNPPGMTVHTQLTFLLGPLYLAGPLLMAKGASRVAPLYRWLFVASAAFWLVFARAFKLSPTGYDGIVEKTAVAATLLWTLPLSWMFLVRGYDERHRLMSGTG